MSGESHIWRRPVQYRKADGLWTYRNRMSKSAKNRVQNHGGYKMLPSPTVAKGSHVVPFCRTCMIIRICIIAHLFSNNTVNLENRSSYMKWIVSDDKCFIVSQVVFSFCNCEMMQGSDVSNLLVLWACIKKGGGSMSTSKVCFCCTKMLADLKKKKKDEDSARGKQWALIVMITSDESMTVWWERITEKKINVYKGLYRRYIWINCSGWESDASVDCVIVLYDWKLIIYSLVPTRLLALCLPCYCCRTLEHFNRNHARHSHAYVWRKAESSMWKWIPLSCHVWMHRLENGIDLLI